MMSPHLLRTAIILLIATHISGCGTALSLAISEETICDEFNSLSRVYSGAAIDYRCIYHPDQPETNNVEFLCIIDMPISIVLDTIVLPYTGYTQLKYGDYCTIDTQN